MINWDDLEFIEDGHIYVYQGQILPSITQILNKKFGKKYAHVDREVLKRASELGTQTHEAIERYCKDGTETDIKELRNFKFLQTQYNFDVLKNEVPVLLFKNGEPICAGRLDMVIEMNGQKGIADIKRVATLDKEYLGYQLNLYRIAYMQSYGEEIDFLRGIHLRDDVRKFVKIPINEGMAWDLVEKGEQ